ncbi:hypothetical protein MASR1M42_25000 [Azonexus hydrophilus]
MRIDWDALLPPKSPEPAEPPAKVGIGGTAQLDEPNDEPAPATGIAAREAAGDNRRRCTECGNLTERGICRAAERGEIVASRSYTPIRDLLRRCETFAPLPTDPDQTPGRIKWAWLRDDAQPKVAPS